MRLAAVGAERGARITLAVKILTKPSEPYRDNKTADERRFYSSRAWRYTSEQHRLAEPFCRECKREGSLVLSQCVDHIIPIRQGGDPWDAGNLQSLCNFHHNQKRKRESLGL